MAAKKKTVDQIVADEFPGWKVVKKTAARKASPEELAADTATPSLDAIKNKMVGDTARRSAKKKAAKKKAVKHAKFVTIAPEGQPDAQIHQQKVILVRDGKVVARQG